MDHRKKVPPLWSKVKSKVGLMTLLPVTFIVLFLVFPLQATSGQLSSGSPHEGVFSHLGPTQPTVLQPEELPTRGQLSPPRRSRPRHLNSTQIKTDANELAALAQKIPKQVTGIQNIYPKDLSKQLKEIEKLSKRLRREISQ